MPTRVLRGRFDKKKPDQHASVNEMNRYIRDRYEMGKWVADGGEGDPRPGGKPSGSPRAAAPEPTPRAPQSCESRASRSRVKAQPQARGGAGPDLLCVRRSGAGRGGQSFAAFGQAPPQQQAPFDAFGTQATRARRPRSLTRSPARRPRRPAARAAAGVERRDPVHVQRAAVDAARRAMPGGFPMQPAPSMPPRGPPMGFSQPPRPMGFGQPPMMQPQQGFAAFGQARPPPMQQQQGMMMARQMQQPMGFPPQQQQMGYAPPPMPPQMGMMGGGSMPSPMMIAARA